MMKRLAMAIGLIAGCGPAASDEDADASEATVAEGVGACWDLDDDGQSSTGEDVNGDGFVDVRDCEGSGQVPLLVLHIEQVWIPDVGTEDPWAEKCAVNTDPTSSSLNMPVATCCPGGFSVVGADAGGRVVCLEQPPASGRTVVAMLFDADGDGCGRLEDGSPADCCPESFTFVGWDESMLCLEDPS